MTIVVKQRNASFDIAKGIAIYLVVLGHLVSVSTLRIPIDFTHMPVFFFIAGWFFARRFGFDGEDEGRQIIIKAKRLLLPFLFWSLIALVFNVFMQVRSSVSFLDALMQQSVDIFIHARSLWFLLILFFMFFYMLVCHFVARRLHVNRYVFAIVGWLLLYIFAPDNEAFSIFRFFKFEWVFPLFMLGCILGGKPELIQRIKGFYVLHKTLVILALFGCFVLMYGCFDSHLFDLWGAPNVFAWPSPTISLWIVGYYALSFSGVLMVLLLSGRLTRTCVAVPLEVAGRYSLDVYVMHMFFVSAYRLVLPPGVAETTFGSFVVAPIASLIAVAVIVVFSEKVLDRIPFYRKLMRG